MRLNARAVMVLAVLAALAAGLVTAGQDTAQAQSQSEIPPLPLFYAGSVTIDGEAPPEGLTIIARIEDYESTAAAVVKGAYENLVVGPPRRAYNGRQITFHLNGVVQAAETATYVIPGANESVFRFGFDLTFDRVPEPGEGVTSTPTATPEPTPEPGQIEGELPPLPAIYGGSVTVAGSAPPAGLTVVAKISGYVSEPVNVVGGAYENLVVGPPNTTFNDHQITFHLDGKVQAAETATYKVQSSPTAIFHLGFDLTFANLPQPDPTPTPVVALPAIYAGEIVVSGGLVPDGATLVARIGSYESAAAVVVDQTYEMLVVNPGDIALVGQPVEFVLNGETAITMGMYVSGANNDSFLLVFHALPTPTPAPTPEATPEPTPEATPEPTPVATPEPTPEPTPEATPEPTPVATPEPTPEPTPEATPEPTPEITPEPTPEPTPEMTPEPTPEPTAAMTAEPTPEATATEVPAEGGGGCGASDGTLAGNAGNLLLLFLAPLGVIALLRRRRQ